MNQAVRSHSPINGSLRTLVRISLPIMIFLFCEALTTFGEWIFLSCHSMEAFQGAMNATYLATIFQSPCIVIGCMAQVFVGLYHGAGEYNKIGPCVWQLIWFSFFSFLLTLPLSFLASSIYFKGTSIEKVGVEYFKILAFGNFLFPLSNALASFYLGRGKTLLVTSLMLASYGLTLILSRILILGIEGYIPAFGSKGAAYAKCISLGSLCLLFFCCFLIRANREVYRTDKWHFLPRALWNYARPGLVRAFGFLSTKVCWAIICYMVVKKGGEHLDVLTIGGAIIMFCLFIPNGIYKGVLTIASNLIGAGRNEEIWKLCRTFITYILLVFVFLTIPLIFFPNSLIYFFDENSKKIFQRTFQGINHWIWIYMFAITIQTCFCSLLVAWRDFKFQLACYLFIWPVAVLPVYFGLTNQGWGADKLWVIMAAENVVYLLCFYIRLRQKQQQQLLSN